MSRYEFIYVCDKKFEDLEGESERERFCASCHFQVLNFDAMTPAEQAEILQGAIQSGERLCASATVAGIDNFPCHNGNEIVLRDRKQSRQILLGIIGQERD
jgi:hypothetical protein